MRIPKIIYKNIGDNATLGYHHAVLNFKSFLTKSQVKWLLNYFVKVNKKNVHRQKFHANVEFIILCIGIHNEQKFNLLKSFNPLKV